MALWVPTDLASAAAWFDAGDGTTITEETGVSLWSDKTSNGRDLAQASTAAQPIYDGSAKISFDGANQYLTRASFAYAFGALTAYVVATDSGGADDDFVASEGNTGQNNTIYTIFNRWSTAAPRLLTRADNGTQLLSVNGGDTSAYDGSKRLVGFIDTGSNAKAYVDATLDIDAEYSRSTALTPNNFSVGALSRGSVGNYWVGDVFEIVIVSEALGTDDRQKLEGYLAHNNGIEANLPAEHPYKTNPPANDATPPSDVSSSVTYADEVGSTKDLFFGWTDGTDETLYSGATAGYVLSGDTYLEQTDGTFSNTLTDYKKRANENGAGRCAAAAPGVSSLVTDGIIRAFDAADNTSDLEFLFSDVSGGEATPSAPTLSVVDDRDGNSATATISNTDTGTVTNTVYTQAKGASSWVSSGSRSGDGTVSLTLARGEYSAVVVSDRDGKKSLPSNTAYFRVSSEQHARQCIRAAMSSGALKTAQALGVQITFTNPGDSPVTVWANMEPSRFSTSLLGRGGTDFRELTFEVPRQTGFPPAQFDTGCTVTHDSKIYSVEDVNPDMEDESQASAFRLVCGRYTLGTAEIDS